MVTAGGSGTPPNTLRGDRRGRARGAEAGTTTDFTVNAANQVTAAGSTTYSYDDAGNLTGDSSGRQLDYNAAGQLTGMKASSSASMVDVEYAGDGNFERVAYGSTDFADSLLGTSAREGGGTPDASYVRDPNGTLTVVREGSQRRYVIADMLGSVIALTDESGAVTQEYTYTPYGQTTETAHAGAVSNPWRYTGAYHDQAQSLYKMGIRYLQPSIGKFTQPDPALSQARLTGANPYAYANCNPTNNTDPTGALSWQGWLASYVWYANAVAVCWAVGVMTGLVGGIVCGLVFWAVETALIDPNLQ